MKCPDGGDCFALDCQQSGRCQGYEVSVEAVTVVHTTIRSRRIIGVQDGNATAEPIALSASASLSFGPGKA